MIDKKFEEILSKYEFVVIPTDGVMDMWQDDLGLVRMTVGVGKSNQENGNMLIFANHDTFHRLGGDNEND